MLPDKQSLFTAALDEGEVVLSFYAEHSEAVIPGAFASDITAEGSLTFKYSLKYRLPMTTGPQGVFAVLSKKGQNYETFVPWDAVVLMHQAGPPHQTAVWATPVPTTKTQPQLPTPAKARGSLRVVEKED